MSDSRKPTADRQRELIDAALEIIARRGIAALSTRALAEHVGLSTGAIFRHFPSLDALLEAVVASVEAALDGSFPPDALAPRARLLAFVEARSAAVGARPGIMRPILSEQFMLALPADGAARLRSCVQKTRAFLHRCVADGQSAGVFRRDLDARALTLIALGTVQVLVMTAAIPWPGAPPRAATIDALLALLSAPDPKAVAS